MEGFFYGSMLLLIPDRNFLTRVVQGSNLASNLTIDSEIAFGSYSIVASYDILGKQVYYSSGEGRLYHIIDILYSYVACLKKCKVTI